MKIFKDKKRLEHGTIFFKNGERKLVNCAEVDFTANHLIVTNYSNGDVFGRQSWHTDHIARTQWRPYDPAGGKQG